MEADAIRQTLPEVASEASPAAGLGWSAWSRCESSFSLLLVPHLPGVFALAEEVAAPAGRRMLAMLHVAEADHLARALSRLFAAESPLRSKLAEGRCYVRFAAIADAARRAAVAAALQQWLAAASDSASAIAADFTAAAISSAGASPAVARAPSPAPIVNRQSHHLRPSPLPAGF